MPKFRRKPVEVEAFQWTGGPDQAEDPGWACEAVRDGKFIFHDGACEVKTRDGWRFAWPGCWVILLDSGYLALEDADVFEATYEPVEDSQ